MDADTYWNNFLIQNNLPLDTKYYEVFCFGYTEKTANDLLDLVLVGEKTATSSAQAGYLLDNEKEPQVNEYSIITNFAGEPKCIIQTYDVLKLKFKDVTYDICKLEGEDLTLKSWQDNHIDFFSKEAKEIGYKFNGDSIIIFEKFKVVYK